MKVAVVAAFVAALSIAIGASSPSLAQQGRNPEGVNPTHFECYEVTDSKRKDNFRQRPVKLRDQFGESTKAIGKTAFLCNPVIEKDGVPYRRDQKTHLVCYFVEPSGPPQVKPSTKNQFGDEELSLGGVKILCVPSLKAIPRAPVLRQ